MPRLPTLGSRPARLAVAAAIFVVATVGSSTGASAANRWPEQPVGGTLTTQGPLKSWIVYANGRVAARGFHAGARNLPLAQPIVGMAATPRGKGYWLAAADGGVFAYGKARFHGSMGGWHLEQPIVGIATTSHGGGYWLVAADGGVFSFGNARFYGSLGGRHLEQPIVGITRTRSGRGYYLLARDGGVFAFGDAGYYGSLGGTGVTDAIGLATTPAGHGYWILRRSGGKHCASPYFGCGNTGVSPYESPYAPGPSVANFGNALPLQPSFPIVDALRPTQDVDFRDNPVVAIVANRSTQGYVVLRPNGAVGLAGALPTAD